jgi:tRNA threonylcarbamoyladenosine biosynthesis protein TsaB
MSLILCIDTAVENASVCLAENNIVLKYSECRAQKEHASWIHNAIRDLFQNTGYSLSGLDAVAVSAGPGSYTGLRVGLSTAKGFCFALGKPLITINTLVMMANAVPREKGQLICPMIDARRMEVFFALYSDTLEEITAPRAAVLDSNFLSEELNHKSIVFIGNGVDKFRSLSTSHHAHFSEATFGATHLVSIADKLLAEKNFADLAYVEPLYVKPFFTGSR